jgi:hypothetical protein
MLSFTLTPYASTTWSWTGDVYTTADRACRITPLVHPVTEHAAVTDGTRTLLVVRERQTAGGTGSAAPAGGPVAQVSPADYDRALANVLGWPADYVAVETRPGHPCRVSAGAARTTPLYLAADGGTLHGSWNLADLRSSAVGICAREAARLLTYRPRYGTETLFTGIRRLTERATAVFGGSLYLHYPEPALHAAPRDLMPGADVLAAFTTAIDNALDARILDLAATVFHLTGGFDSGTLATRAACRWPGQVMTGALLVTGAGRQQQIRRRAKILAGLPFAGNDLVVDCAAVSPLQPDCPRVRGELISPYDEPLYRPFWELTSFAREHGARALVTGLGGDELVAVSPEESPDAGAANDHLTRRLPWLGPQARAALPYADDGIAPPAPVNAITLLTLETTAPPLLRAGLWPVHPFTDPALIRLGEQLPLCWREDKQLQRRQLASLGYDDDVCTLAERESFTWLVEDSVKRHGTAILERMLVGGSPLFEDKLIDPDQLRNTIAEISREPWDEEYHAKLLQVIDVHLATAAFL